MWSYRASDATPSHRPVDTSAAPVNNPATPVANAVTPVNTVVTVKSSAITESNAPSIGDETARVAAPARDRLDSGHLPGPDAVADQLAALRQRTAATILRSKSEATLRAYQSDFAAFQLWCRRFGLPALPAEPDTVALYLTACSEAGAALSTLRRRVVAVSQAHRATGHLPSPTQGEAVRRTMAGLARTHGSRPHQVVPIRLATLKAMLDATPEDDLLAVRDRAVLLLGFASGMRSSELSGLDVGDLTFVEQGIDVLIRRSKTDPAGHGRTIGIPRGRHLETCPVLAVERWLSLSGLGRQDPLFPRLRANGRPTRPPRRRHPAGRIAPDRLSPQAIARTVQRAACRAGLDPAQVAGHSLRSGFATEAAAQGAPERAIMRQTGHTSLEMVRRYIREGDRYRENASAYLGL
jgi:integrase